MPKRFFYGLALCTLAALQSAVAHELAFSKSENVLVLVPGDAGSWCKDSLALTFERDRWDDKAPLERLLPKIPFILGQDCPQAKVVWKAQDKAGKVFAQGNGNASNLGLINLETASTSARDKSSPTATRALDELLLDDGKGPIPTQPEAPKKPSTAPKAASALSELLGNDSTAPAPARAEKSVPPIQAAADSGQTGTPEPINGLGNAVDTAPKGTMNPSEQEKLYRTHKLFLEGYESAQNQMGRDETEEQFVAKKWGVVVDQPWVRVLMNPRYQPGKFLVNIAERDGDHYRITSPLNGRLYNSTELQPGWHIVRAVSRTYVEPMEDGKVIPALQGYTEDPEACAKERCADVLNLTRYVVSEMKFDHPEVNSRDFNPESSRRFITQMDTMNVRRVH